MANNKQQQTPNNASAPQPPQHNNPMDSVVAGIEKQLGHVIDQLKQVDQTTRANAKDIKELKDGDLEVTVSTVFKEIGDDAHPDAPARAKELRRGLNADDNFVLRLIHRAEETRVGKMAKTAKEVATYGALGAGAGYGIYKGVKAVSALIRGDVAEAVEETTDALGKLTD